MIKRTIHPWELITRESFRFNEVANYPVYRNYQQAQLLLKHYSWESVAAWVLNWLQNRQQSSRQVI